MNRFRYLLLRFVWAVIGVWLVLSALFVLVAAPPDPNAAFRAWFVALGGGNASAAIESYQEARGLDASLFARYLNFMTGMITLQWGTSLSSGRPVVDIVAERGTVTAAYVIPAVLISTLLGTLVGVYVSMKNSKIVDTIFSGVAYTGYGIPDFWLAIVLATFLSGSFFIESSYTIGNGIFDPANLRALLVPTATLTVTLFAVQLRYVRSEVREGLRQEFTKLLRAKGVTAWRMARHAVRYAAIPLVSLLFTEFLAILLVSVFIIETALGLPGLGDLLFFAIEDRDVPVVMAVAFIPIVIGIFGNFIQDALYTFLEPRFDSD